MVGFGYGERGRVLVVDDDPAVCAMVVEMLADMGFEPVDVQTEGAAYAEVPTLPTFRALVTDLELGPGASGFDVARLARRVVPDLVVIYMSGRGHGADVEASGVPGGAFLQKPFTADDLLRLLGPMLEP